VTVDARTLEARRFLRQLEIANGMVAAVALVITHLAMGPGPLLTGVLVGGLVCAVNLRAMIWLGMRVILARQHSRGFYGMLFALKLGLLGAMVWAALSLLAITAVGFMIGFSSILPALLAMTLKRALEPATPHPHAPLPPHPNGEQQL